MTDLPRTIDATLEVEGGVATLTFQRDDIRNALTGSHLIEDITGTAEWINHTPDISVLVITGAGKAFSSGGNVKEMRDRSASFSGPVNAIETQYREGIQKIPLAVQAIEVPVIAAVNGPAIGAGCDLACMCDIRIGST
ncbi:MAG: enoyl-CoA hydratase-related protein, partial [Hyphomicrobiales bacterium]